MNQRKTDPEFSEERVVPDFKEQHNLFQEHFARYKFAAKYVLGKQVLDAACGCGYGGKLFADSGAQKVTGIDISKAAIKYSTTHYRSSGLTFKLMDCQKLLFKDQAFDVVTAFEFIEHLSLPGRFLREVDRVLKTQGVFGISTPNNLRNSPIENKYHLRENNAVSLRSLLKPFFSKIDLYGQRYKPSITRRTKHRQKLVNSVPKFVTRYLPSGLKDYLFSRLINHYLLNLKNEADFNIDQNEIGTATHLIGVCYK